MGRRSKRILAGVGLAVATVLILVSGFALAARYALTPSPARRPPITDGLPPDFREANRAFSKRILSAFPVGASEADLVRELEAQGFVQSDIEGRRHLRFVQQSFPCRLTWSVDWSAGSDHRIGHIEATYHGVCL